MSHRYSWQGAHLTSPNWESSWLSPRPFEIFFIFLNFKVKLRSFIVPPLFSLFDIQRFSWPQHSRFEPQPGFFYALYIPYLCLMNHITTAWSMYPHAHFIFPPPSHSFLQFIIILFYFTPSLSSLSFFYSHVLLYLLLYVLIIFLHHCLNDNFRISAKM